MCDLSIVIVNWNTRDLLRACLASLHNAARRIACEIIVVDNASTDGSIEMVRAAFPRVRLMALPENVGFARANNIGFAQAQGRYFLLLNPDTWLPPGALDEMIALMDQMPNVGILGPRLLNADGSLQPSCSRFPTPLNIALDCWGISRIAPQNRMLSRFKMTWWAHDEAREVDQPSGACLLVRREAWHEAGPLDERFFMYFEEVDLCWRVQRAGWRICFTPTPQITHYGGQSSLQNLDARIVQRYASLVLFFRKHYGALTTGALCCAIAPAALARALLAAIRAATAGQRRQWEYAAQYWRVTTLLCSSMTTR
ncbi:glycosyltransferase family 2 protein [Roseiflexus sp.]|uniref:glycosyltransferase family 2 protein n=1 Tax=Roseiflexus sp. TaxID=2562120 RepID=UPI0021DCD382|nr:glycosyltransferase family 2 protein [Roseiflexus sp.]GIW00313.1 MAG: glycosyl transferase [Roseiflexus sp.]